MKEKRSDEIRDALSVYLSAKGNPDATFKINDFSQLKSGRQHEMFSFTLVEKLSGTDRILPSILRMYDGAQAGEDAEYEYLLMKKVKARGVPAPDVFYLERDAGHLDRPFIIMERVEGETLTGLGLRKIKLDPTWPGSEEAINWTDKFAALLASVHKLDPQTLDLKQLRQNRWELVENPGFLHKLRGYQIPSLKMLLAAMADWIDKAIRNTPNHKPVLLHYDFHFENVMVSDGRIAALLDWCEVCTGEAAFDVAWSNLILHTIGMERLIEPFVSAYKHHSNQRLENLTAYEGLAGLRQLSDILILKEVGAESLNKRPDAAALYDIRRELSKTIDFMSTRVGIDLGFLIT